MPEIHVNLYNTKQYIESALKNIATAAATIANIAQNSGELEDVTQEVIDNMYMASLLVHSNVKQLKQIFVEVDRIVSNGDRGLGGNTDES